MSDETEKREQEEQDELAGGNGDSDAANGDGGQPLPENLAGSPEPESEQEQQDEIAGGQENQEEISGDSGGAVAANDDGDNDGQPVPENMIGSLELEESEQENQEEIAGDSGGSGADADDDSQLLQEYMVGSLKLQESVRDELGDAAEEDTLLDKDSGGSENEKADESPDSDDDDNQLLQDYMSGSIQLQEAIRAEPAEETLSASSPDDMKPAEATDSGPQTLVNPEESPSTVENVPHAASSLEAAFQDAELAASGHSRSKRQSLKKSAGGNSSRSVKSASSNSTGSGEQDPLKLERQEARLRRRLKNQSSGSNRSIKSENDPRENADVQGDNLDVDVEAGEAIKSNSSRSMKKSVSSKSLSKKKGSRQKLGELDENGLHFDVEDIDARDALMNQREGPTSQKGPFRDDLNRRETWALSKKAKQGSTASGVTDRTESMKSFQKESWRRNDYNNGNDSDAEGGFVPRIFPRMSGLSFRRNRQPKDFDDDVSEDDSEYSQSAKGQNTVEYMFHQRVYTLSNPWFPSLILSCFFTASVLVLLMCLFFDMVGRMWVICAFSSHLLLTALGGIGNLALFWNSPAEPKLTNLRGISLCALTSLASLADIILFTAVYPSTFKKLDHVFLTESDGSSVPEYTAYKTVLQAAIVIGGFIAASRITLGTLFWGSVLTQWRFPSTQHCLRGTGLFVWWVDTIVNVRKAAWFVMVCLAVVSAAYFGYSFYATLEYFVGFADPLRGAPGPQCDPLDLTECMLPFPSYHFTVKNSAATTGYQVNLEPEVFPKLRARKTSFQADFLNQMDGFSTMGPIMFYILGLKQSMEAAEKDPNLAKMLKTHLIGSSDIADSITEKSMTLLVDVKSQKLVPHSAEIDYFDPENPMVVLFPSQPLKHNSHYAVAVVNAVNVISGERFPPTYGMSALMKGKGPESIVRQFNGTLDERKTRFEKIVIPSLEKAAPWFSNEEDPDALQLLFDWPTVSEESQLGLVRGVRDGTMNILSDDYWSWEDHARLSSVEDFNCLDEGTLYARTINAEIDVPWFLDNIGVGQRASFLNTEAVDLGIPVSTGSSKFSLHVPCSVWAATVPESGSVKPHEISAVVEYGHSMFTDRNEANSPVIQQLANKEGYIVTAMDWRGMTVYDLLIVFKAMVANPSMFQAVRDNLIQGFACKLAMQHFSRYGLWSTDWLTFESGGNAYQPRPNDPAYVFYGHSHGGILGAGYTALAGRTGLIDRSVLAVPGTPFSLVITRNLAVEGYEDLLILNFYNNRDVRLMTALLQMTLDCTEASGFLAQPIREPAPPVLIQSGLGDSTIPSTASHALARGFGASLLPHHPQPIFGLTSSSRTGRDLLARRGSATFTEFMFQAEHESLPKNGNSYGMETEVHRCLPQDKAALDQVAAFITHGIVVDVCAQDNCVRPQAHCEKFELVEQQ